MEKYVPWNYESICGTSCCRSSRVGTALKSSRTFLEQYHNPIEYSKDRNWLKDERIL